MRRNQFWRMPQRLTICPPPLRSSARLHSNSHPGKVRAGQPVPEAFTVEFLLENFASSSIEAYHVERALGQVDANGDKGGFRSDFRLFWGFHGLRRWKMIGYNGHRKNRISRI